MSIVTTKIANNVLDGIIGIQGVRRNYDSSTDERRCFTITPKDIETYNTLFKYNGGVMSDGKYVKLYEALYYLRIPVNISMVDQDDLSFTEQKVVTLEERAKANLPSLNVFVDGYKLPDCEVKMYPTKSNVDILIPNKYIDFEKGNDIVVEKKRYDLYRYIHFYSSKIKQQTFAIPLPSSVDASSIKERNVQIYLNKKLYGSSRTINVSNGVLYVILTTEINESEIEIVIDPYIMYYFAFTSLSYGDNPVYEIPESYIDSIHGPISKFSCMFYLNGLRIGNTNVDQKGRLHFEYDLKEKVGGNISFYLSDRNKIVDTDQILYGSDYYLYNFIGCGAVTSALKTSLSGNKYIDAGSNRYLQNLEATYKLGTNKVVITLPDTFILSDADKVSLKIGDKEVKEEHYAVDKSKTPITITITSPAKYMTIGTSVYASISVESWFDWDEVLNNNSELYSRSKLKEILKIYNSGVDPSTKVANALSGKPYLMRTFLENYGYNRYIQDISYNGTDSYVFVGIPSTIDVSSGKNYDISVNNKHIPSDDIVIVDKDVTSVFQIDGTYFDTGTNEVEIQIFDDISCEYKEFTPNKIKNYDGINILEIKGYFTPEKLGDVESNIIIMEKVDSTDDTVVNFATDYNIGYKLFTGYTISYDSAEDTVYIVFTERPPENNFVVYNKNYSKLYKYTKTLDSDISDVVIPLYMGTDANPIPYISRGKIYVYSGTDRLVEGTDYFIKDPTNLDSVGCSFLILKRAVLPGSTIDVYFTDIKTTVLYNKTGYFSNNKYGLFYFSSLRFPFSLSYMNMYLNGQKLSESDVDILSDKLVRVHSLPTPLYDLCIESAFTVEMDELEPYIQEYKEDNFELYLASLFKSVSYDRNFELDEQAYDANEIYKSFIETVDSVDRVPNPVSREGEWIPSYNDDESLIGPFSEGDVVLGNNINASLIVGSTYIVGADNGKVASCTLNNNSCEWTPCDYYSLDSSNTRIHSNGAEFNNEDITAMILYKGYVVFGTRNGHIVCYNPTTNEWKNDNSFPMCNVKWPEGTRINGFIINTTNDSLYVYGDNGTVDSFSWETGEWNGFEYSAINVTGIGVTGVMGNIYGALLANRNSHQVLIVFGEKGEVASCYIDYNTWIKPNGVKMYSVGIAPTIFDDGSIRNYKDIYSIVKYGSDYVLLGEDGEVTYFSVSSFTCSNDDVLKISNDGSNSGSEDINSAVVFNEKMIITGGNLGRVSEYEGESASWYNYNSESGGIVSDGHYMDGNDIYTMQKTTNSTNYIIFAGKNGKVSSYNVDVDEVPYRYDPYKTCFLKWYNSEGNAIIRSKWDIPENISSKFDMYKEGNESGNICIRGGDDDVMTPIDMNDAEKYPWTVEARKRFIVNFIKSLPEGRYTPDEVEELYKNSPAANMLYIEDVEKILFASGDDTDSDEDIDLTTI